jgi:hypothetical protein
MEYALTIDLLALKRWIGKVDAAGVLLASFIAKLNPHNPRVANLMHDGYFLLTRRWIIGELPVLQLSEDTLGRRLADMKKIGLLDLNTAGTPADIFAYMAA